MQHDDFIIRRAVASDAAAVAPLFDAYRQFYGKESNRALAEQFLERRLTNGESIVLVAESRTAGVEPLGFVQLYPTFSSIGCGPAWVLNDLFVAEGARRVGVAEALMHAATGAAKRAGVPSISLSTAHDNFAAQALYTKLGYILDEQFRTYSLAVPTDAA
jgi:ribosomal protein S18 acetylase RimI-like enzyme